MPNQLFEITDNLWIKIALFVVKPAPAAAASPCSRGGNSSDGKT